ncbi:YceD family protein [Streptococcus phocae subsp. phocae]|uniref:DNA-binding protein n=1 Tax=Streptococcus phocae TaxID=119224 RepID=A0A0P6S6F4_9STRE|nr:YceD family protein [Streptococcus phocae]KPJ21814.1 DNA-binding protein [Streptococcus phocae]
MLLLSEIKKQADGIRIDQEYDVKEKLLERDQTIIDIKQVRATGKVQFDDGLFLLDYRLTYQLTLPSSRSMEPVELRQEQDIHELFVESHASASKQDLVDEHLVLILSEDKIDIEESIVDNILLAIPLQVLTEDEKKTQDLPAGQDWAVLTEEQYALLKAEQEKDNNPFAGLQGLFDE